MFYNIVMKKKTEVVLIDNFQDDDDNSVAETMRLSEKVLARDWDRLEEDEAWADL